MLMLNRIRKSFQATMNLIVVNMDQWFRTPRTIVMLVAALVICYVEVSKINRVFMDIITRLIQAKVFLF